MYLQIEFFSKFLKAIFTAVIFNLLMELFHMLVEIADLSEVFTAIERAGERAFLAV